MSMTSEQAEQTRRFFRVLNKFMVAMWRLGLGKMLNSWPEVGGRIMVIVNTGRKSGKRRLTPVNYTVINGDVYCTAGFGAIADWYRNIQANPQVEIWLPDGWWAGVAEEYFDPEGRLPVMRKVLKASGFAARIYGIDVDKIEDQDLEKVTRDYRLFRIRRITARTGPGGPGELSWVWQVTTLLLFLRLLSRKRK